MDRPPHDYSAAAAAAAAAAAMAFAQQQQQQQYGFHPQHQQFPTSVHGPPFLPPHPSLQQYPFPHQQQPQTLHPHPPHPHLLHLQQQQPPPPNFPPHMPPQLVNTPFGGGPGPYDSASPPVPPPPDPELHKRIDKLSEYVAKNGPEFEAMVRDREHDNPQYSFLFGGEGHGYYRYKLWMCARPPGPFNASYPSSMSVMHGAPNPMLSPHGPPLNPAVAGASASLLGASPLQRPPFSTLYDQQHHQYMGHGQIDPSKSFMGIPGPLPSDVAIELNNVLGALSGTKESIKGAKMWFMQRSPFAPGLAEALRERVFAVDDSEKQLHIIYLVNDILFDSLQRRVNPHDLDNEALAFKPVVGSMLARIYHNPHNKDENQSRLQKILQFWATKEVYDQETIHAFEAEMLGGPPAFPLPGPPKELRGSSFDTSAVGGLPNLPAQQLQQDKLNNLTNQEQPDRNGAPLTTMQPGLQFAYPPFIASVALSSAGLPSIQQPGLVNVAEKPPPYPLFPPGLIPGMVRKQQIGSGVPYSPMSPLDIPTVIPPSDIPESELLERVSKFFKEIGEVNPSEGPMNSSEGRYEDEYERESPVRKGGACIPPPPNLQAADPDTGTNADGSVKVSSGGSGRLGLGATADPNEPSQYDDVYTSYRKQRSTNYHTSMSVRAVTR